jgi:radical SAM superfamily enzyme YgiQ (UPF0313 family)
MKITLILAAAPGDPLRKNDPFMPLSLPLIAASAPEHEYTFVDMLAGESVDFKKPCDLVGISARITAEKTAFAIADEYRKRKVLVVLGGAQASSNPHAAIEHVDAVVIGEGEGVWPILLRDIENRSLRRFYVGSARPFDARGQSVYQQNEFLDLSTIHNAVEMRKLYKRKYVFDTVFAARGCAIGCDFCSVGQIFGHKTRTRPLDEVVKEIASFRRFYYLLDDTVFGRPPTYSYYGALYDRIAAHGKVNLWTGQANLDAASTSEGREVIKKAANAGLVYAAVGMESINPEVMRKANTISKNGSRDLLQVVPKMKENIRFIQDQGIGISGWFTIGYEEDTVDTFFQTLQFCEETNIIPVLCPLEALPGTPLFERLSAEGRVDLSKKVNIVHPTMSDDDILTAITSCTRQGFSLSQIYKRTRFFKNRLSLIEHTNNMDARAVIEKVIFYFVLQVKMKKGVIGLANADASK